MKLPKPPYYAVIFSSTLTDNIDGYAEMAAHTEALASQQPGYLGFETARAADGYGVSISYWSDLDAIQNWRDQVEHQTAIKLGYERWYRQLHIKITRVERAYDWKRP